MIRIWGNRWPIVRWGLLAAALGGLGWALDALLPPEPRWVQPWTFSDLTFSPEGSRMLLSRPREKKPLPLAQLWDLESGSVLAEYGEKSTGVVIAEAISPNFRYWATITVTDHTYRLQIVDLDSGAVRKVTLAEKEIQSDALRFSPDGAIVAMHGAEVPGCAGAGEILLYDAVTGEPLARLPDSEQRHADFTADGRFFLHCMLGKKDDVLGVWDVAARKSVAPLRPFSIYYAVSPDGKRVASFHKLDDDRWRIWAWDLATQTRHALGDDRPGFQGWFSPDGRWLAVVPGTIQGTVEWWDVHNGRLRGVLPPVHYLQ